MILRLLCSWLTDFRITDDSPEQSDVDDTVYNQAEIKRLTKAVQKFADGKDKYQEVVYQLKKDKLWFGSYYSLKNLQVIHQFFTMRALRSKSEEEGPDGRVKLTIEDVDWWVRSGPQLGAAVIWSDDSNCPNQRNRKVAEKKAQLEHYINSVTSGGPICNSVKTYEKEAKRLGVHPWSGYLIDVIVAMAQDLEDDETMTKHDSSRTLLDSSCLQDACARMFTRRV